MADILRDRLAGEGKRTLRQVEVAHAQRSVASDGIAAIWSKAAISTMFEPAGATCTGLPSACDPWSGSHHSAPLASSAQLPPASPTMSGPIPGRRTRTGHGKSYPAYSSPQHRSEPSSMMAQALYAATLTAVTGAPSASSRTQLSPHHSVPSVLRAQTCASPPGPGPSRAAEISANVRAERSYPDRRMQVIGPAPQRAVGAHRAGPIALGRDIGDAPWRRRAPSSVWVGARAVARLDAPAVARLDAPRVVASALERPPPAAENEQRPAQRDHPPDPHVRKNTSS